MILDGKRFVITGILTDDSIAFHTARTAQEQGAEIVATGFGRGLRLTERAVQRLPTPCKVLELDINEPAHMAALVADLERLWGGVDGALHAIAFAPADALGGNFLNTPPESAQTAFMVSAFSYKTLAVGLLPLLEKAGGGSLVTLDFDNTQAWPVYDWMGVAKSALELARPTHGRGQPFSDRQAQTGSALAASIGVLQLAEGFEGAAPYLSPD